jgi:membrane protease YdiL (CAAX protease family)
MNVLKEIIAIKFDFTKDTKMAFLLGTTVVGLSFTLRLFQEDTSFNGAVFFIILDILIKVFLGFYVPLYYILVKTRQGIGFFGLTKDKWLPSFILGLVFMGLLIVQFMSESVGQGKIILLRLDVFIPIFYIFVAGIFEIIFIYGFLRRIFDKSFGVIPGIILTSLFYSFHHAGFQPEFGKLIYP